MRRLKWLFLLGALAYALTGVVQVRPGELGVVRRFGRVLPQRAEPGLWVGLPWGMDRLDRVLVDRVQSIVVGFQEDDSAPQSLPTGQMLTGDHNLVNVQVTVYYKVRPEQVEDYVAQADRVEALLARATESVMAQWVASRPVDDVLLSGKNALRLVLANQIEKAIADYRLGTQVLDARVAILTPPEEVKPAFDSVALEQTRIATRRHQAEQEAEAGLRGARAEKYHTEQVAAAYAYAQEQLARREAERFLERLRQYQQGLKKNPDYLRQIWQEERGRLLAKLKENNQIDLLDHHLGAGGLDVLTAPPLPRK